MDLQFPWFHSKNPTVTSVELAKIDGSEIFFEVLSSGLCRLLDLQNPLHKH